MTAQPSLFDPPVCRFCSADPRAPRHWLTCDGRQGVVEARNAALEQVADHAEAQQPGFAVVAEAFVVGYLTQHGPTSGEVMTNACKAAGIVPHDDRAFGPVYLRLARAGRIVKIGQTVRVKGHLTGGANVWALGAIAA